MVTLRYSAAWKGNHRYLEPAVQLAEEQKQWRRKSGIAALLIGMCLVIGSVWAVHEGQTRWPLRGVLVRATLYQEGLNRKAVRQALKEGAFAERVYAAQTQAAAGSTLGLRESATRVAIHRLRRRFRDCVRAELAQTLAPGISVDDEMRYLFDALKGAVRGD